MALGNNAMFDDNSSTALLDPPRSVEPERALPVRSAPQPLEEPSWIRRGHIPGLDGLRAIAVLLVVGTHAHQTVGFPAWPLVHHLAHQGSIGVDIFFVISGFLITTLLVRELERDEKVQLKRFYARRFLRIMPAYLGLILVVAILNQVGYFHLQARDWIGAATYTTNFLYRPAWELGHTWSLSIEEHFYLLWPFILGIGGVAAGWRVGLSCLAVCWLIRCGIALGIAKRLLPADSPLADVTWTSLMAESWTFTRIDTITMGSLFAIACRTANGRAWLDRLTQPRFVWIYFVALCVSIGLTKSGKYTLCVAYTLNALCIALLMWGLIQSRGIVLRIISHPVLTTVGIGSYSIYLWQQLFLNPKHPGWIHEFPQNIVLAMGAAWLSFWLIEQPFNRLKDRLAA